MASPSSSSSSSKHAQPVWRPVVKLNMKKLETIDDYINSYFTANLLRPQLPHLNKPASMFCQPALDAEPPTRGRSETHRKSRSKTKTEAEKINELAREMDRMLSRSKSKRQTNDLLRLFKNTLSNFIVPEHPMDANSTRSKSDISLKHRKRVSSPTTPLFHQQQHYDHQHYQQSKSQELDDIQQNQSKIFSNHETSVTMTTTTTRCQIKEPKIGVIESSKTNILHRCYGKQSVKALPQIYKSRKKNNSYVSNCQKPPSLKVKSQKLQKLQQQRVTNQQMKTIYENDQFDKSKIISSKNSDNVDDIMIGHSTSASSVDTDKQSTIKMQESNEMIRNDSEKNLFPDSTVSHVTGIRKQALKLINEKNEEHASKTDNRQMIDINIEQDNSIVQRLTSFWNKKLNTLGQTKSTSDQSSVTSSLMSVFEEEYRQRENNLNRNDKVSTCEEIKSEEDLHQFSRTNIETGSPNDRGDISFSQDNDKCKEYSKIENKTLKFRGKNKHNDTDLPDLKMGLMNELLRVLQNRDGRLTDKNTSNDEGVKQNLHNSHEGNVSSDLNSETRSKSHITVNLDDTGDEMSNFDADDYDDDVEDYVEQCDEKTLEAIEQCFLDTMKNEDNNKDIDDFFKKPSQDGMTVTISNDECKESKSGYDIHDVNSCKQLCTIESSDINEPKTVITNVNSIINNLKQLIQIIESIPEELKSVNMNLNSLPIPDKIKNKITLIVSQDNETVDDKLTVNSIDSLNQLQMFVSPVEQKQLFQCCSSGKIIGYTKREGYIYLLYFPKMLTLPTIENVKNPFEKILFPKRHEFLKMMKTKSLNHCLIINQIGTRDRYTDILSNDVQKEQEKTTTSEENHTFKEKPHSTENFQNSTKRTDKEITEIAKPRSTQSSIIYLTSRPSSAITFKCSTDNFFVGQKNTFVLKPSIKAADVFPCSNLSEDLHNDKNSKNTVKYEEHVFIENTSISNNNSVEELSDRSGMSSSPSNCNQQEEYNVFAIDSPNVNDNNSFQIEREILHKESRVNLDEGTPNLLNDLSVINRHFNNSVKRRRYRLQNHNEDDTSILAGGSGDSMQNCGDVIMQAPIPCRNTSSMSVVVSNSVNDSNSQPDININDSELNLSRLRVYGHGSMINRTQTTQDSDNFSTCGVIQEEQSDEEISDIDDCVIKKENKKNSFGTRSSTSISSQNINLSDNQENKKDSFDLVLTSDSSQNINVSSNQDDTKNCNETVSISSSSSRNMNLLNDNNQDVTLVMSQKHIVENKGSVQKINGKACNLKFSYLNLNNATNEESMSKVLCIYKEDINVLQSHELESKIGEEKKVNENLCDKQFLYQNLKNMLHEETITASQSLPNNHIKDDKPEQNEVDKKKCNEIYCDKKFSYQNVEMIKNKDEDATMTRPELKLHSSSSVPGNNPLNCLTIKNMSVQNVDFSHELCSNSCDNIIENVPCNQYSNDKNANNDKEVISIIKNDYHQNYQTYYFETELSKQAQLAIANKSMQNTYKNDLETMLRNDAALKSELSKIIDIDNLCDKEKQLIAACICLMNRNFYNKPPPLFNVSVGNLSLNSSLTNLWNRTSKTMCNRIKLAKKSLLPYDFQTDTLLYQRFYRRLLKSFYTLFITLILIFLIQKHFCGILLPIHFPW